MLAGVMAIASSSVANAQSASANLNVSATVSANCTITTTPVVFGTYDPVVTHAAANLDAQGTVSIACTKGATANIGLDSGGNPLGAARQMSDGGGNLLGYQLYSNGARTVVWGNAAPNWVTPPAAPSKAVRAFDIFGRVPSGQDVPSGGYADVVVATVNF